MRNDSGVREVKETGAGDSKRTPVGRRLQMGRRIGNSAMLLNGAFFCGGQEIMQRVLVPLRQTGANCGMFAMAMAIQELTGRNRITAEEPGDAEEATHKGYTIAQELQAIAVGAGYSTIGEIFDADKLAAVGQIYLRETGLPLVSQAVQFDTEEELRAILACNRENQIRILYPYASLEAEPAVGAEGIERIERSDKGYGIAESGGTGGRLSPQNMHHAHWSVVNQAEGDRVRVYEGHGVMNTKDTDVGTLFRSNQLLGGEMDWQTFIYNRVGRWGEFLSRSAHYEECDKVRFGKVYPDGHKDLLVNLNLHRQGMELSERRELKEHVNLRGRAVVIGPEAQYEQLLQTLSALKGGGS